MPDLVADFIDAESAWRTAANRTAARSVMCAGTVMNDTAHELESKALDTLEASREALASRIMAVLLADMPGISPGIVRRVLRVRT